MARIRVVFESGEPERVIEFDPAKAPFQHDGRPGSILDVLLANGISLEHACGGNCACTTCHVIVKAGSNALTPNEDEEDDLLDKAPGLTPTSRLGCQVYLTPELDGITAQLPAATRNMFVDGASRVSPLLRVVLAYERLVGCCG